MKALAYHRGPGVIEPFLDYLDHSLEVHNLATAEGRQRESIALFLAVHALDNVVRDVDGLRRLVMTIFSQTKTSDRYEPVSAIFASQMERSLPRLPFRSTEPTSSLKPSENIPGGEK